QVPASEFVPESFGNACTLFNPNASRFGKYTELQFSDRGQLPRAQLCLRCTQRRAQLLHLLLPRRRRDAKEHLQLDKTTYRYLGQHRAPNAPNARPTDDAVLFDQLKDVLKTIGLSKWHIAQTCQIVAAILHLGNLAFTINPSRNEDAAVVRNMYVCEIVADFLGLQGDLEQALSYKTKLVKKELCT
ncbi:P-loop containing nucleoside triphosphate hydrolase protein, partial [Mycena galericulata]